MGITAIQDRLPTPDFPTLLEEFKTDFLHVDYTTFDNEMTTFLKSAMELADKYCNNPFESDGVEVSIPHSIKTGVFTLAGFMFERSSPAVTSDKSSRIAKTYKSYQATIEAVQDLYFWPHRKYPGF